MNLTRYLQSQKLDNLGFDTIFIEQPVPNIIQFNWKNILPAPPSNSSQSTYRELLYIIQQSDSRSPADLEMIHQVDQDMDSFFINLLAKYKIEYPYDRILEIYKIIEPILSNLKGSWNRPRPLQLAKFYNLNISTIITDTTHTASYPSGHTVYGNMVAGILKFMFPVVPPALLNDIVDKIALARIKQGVHYPSDNKASIILSNFLINKLKPLILDRNNYGKIS